MLLDVFNGDAFHHTSLVQAVNLIPYVPTRLRDLRLFNDVGIDTVTAMIEMDGDVLRLVPNRPRGAPGQVETIGRRNARPFMTGHLPQRVQLFADEVQGLRAFGKQTETEVAMARLTKKMVTARRNLDLTIEHQRIGAVKGVIMDSDGSTPLLDLYAAFNVSRQTLDMDLTNSATKIFLKNTAILRMIEDKLGGVTMSGVRVFCSSGFFDAYTGHDAIKENYLRQEAAKLREDNRKGFSIGEFTFEEYRGQINGIKFIPDNCAIAVPEGVPDLFTTYYAPPNMMGLVNTEGVPFYASIEKLPHDAGLDVLTQSNPLHICNRPNSVVWLGVEQADLDAALA